MPRVSVIIPTYNRKELLLEAVDSVLKQTYRDFELVVVDDGSNDSTKAALQHQYGNQLIHVYQEHQGVSVARNRGTEIAQGEFVTFLDSDDLWLPRKLAIQIDFMDRHPGAQICYTDEIWVREGVRVNPRRKHAKHTGWIYPHCLPLCIISPSSVCVRRELFGRVGFFDPNLPVCEDYDLWLRVAARLPIFFLPQKLIVKRGGHTDQLSQQSWGNDRYRVMALVKMVESAILSPEMRWFTIEELHRKCKILIDGYEKRNKHADARSYLDLLKRYPLSNRILSGSA